MIVFQCFQNNYYLTCFIYFFFFILYLLKYKSSSNIWKVLRTTFFVSLEVIYSVKRVQNGCGNNKKSCRGLCGKFWFRAEEDIENCKEGRGWRSRRSVCNFETQQGYIHRVPYSWIEGDELAHVLSCIGIVLFMYASRSNSS